MTPSLYAIHENPLPGNATTGFFEGVRSTRLRYAIFKCEDTVARGTVVLLQGRNESIEKYAETISELTARGLWVATFDWRGQGGSDRLLKQRRRGHVGRFADYEADLSIFLEKIVLPDTRLPFFMIAHSMGALVALSQAPYLASRIDRLVALAPFVALGGQKIGHGAIGILAAALTWCGLGSLPLMRDRGSRPFSENLLSSDIGRFSRNAALVEAYPDLALGPPSARWLYETFRAIKRVSDRKHLTRIRVPTIVLAPTQDQLVPHLAVEALCKNFRAGHMIAVDGARHELLQEADHYRAQAVAAIEAFIPGSATEAFDEHQGDETETLVV